MRFGACQNIDSTEKYNTKFGKICQAIIAECI